MSTHDTGGGFDWGSLAGSVVSATGAYLSNQHMNAPAGQTAGALSEKSANWTQMLGLSTIGGFGDKLQAGNQKMLQGYGNAAAMQGALPGIAQAGTQAQLGQIQGAEQGAIQNVLNSQKAQNAQVQQQGAASGFYGGSAQQGMQGQVAANTSQSIADIMGGTASTKASIIGQGTAALSASIQAAASGQMALGEAHSKAVGAEYKLMKDKLNTILATGNSWGIGDWEQKYLNKMAGGLQGAGQGQGKNYGKFKDLGPGQSFGPDTSSAFTIDGNWQMNEWAKQWSAWANDPGIQGFLADIWG